MSGPVFREVRAFAPGSVGNVGPGLDILGLAVAGAGDRVTARVSGGAGLTVTVAGDSRVPSDPGRNTAALAAQAILRLTHQSSLGLTLTVEKGLPLSGGQGGSAASAVAAAVAVNHLLGRPLALPALLLATLEAEEAVAGRHLDNLAPSLLGSAVLIRSMEPLDYVVLPVPENLRIVLVRPEQELRTAEGRAVLPATVDRATALHQAAQVAALVAALASGDLALLGRAIDDRIAEPARAPLLPGFAEAKTAALAAGGLGCSISGSGPTAFALVGDEATAQRVATAMIAAYRERGLTATTRIAAVDRVGARVEHAS
jgi:homoserine kinase